MVSYSSISVWTEITVATLGCQQMFFMAVATALVSRSTCSVNRSWRCGWEWTHCTKVRMAPTIPSMAPYRRQVTQRVQSVSSSAPGRTVLRAVMVEINHKLIRDDLSGRPPRLATGMKSVVSHRFSALFAPPTLPLGTSSPPSSLSQRRPVRSSSPGWRGDTMPPVRSSGQVPLFRPSRTPSADAKVCQDGTF